VGLKWHAFSKNNIAATRNIHPRNFKDYASGCGYGKFTTKKEEVVKINIKQETTPIGRRLTFRQPPYKTVF
jgi:hypothetical protein